MLSNDPMPSGGLTSRSLAGSASRPRWPAACIVEARTRGGRLPATHPLCPSQGVHERSERPDLPAGRVPPVLPAQPVRGEERPRDWGHAVSPDLLHWPELPIALAEAAAGQAFSGPAVYDRNNSSGLFPNRTVGLARSTPEHPITARHRRSRLAPIAAAPSRYFPGNPMLDVGACHITRSQGAVAGADAGLGHGRGSLARASVDVLRLNRPQALDQGRLVRSRRAARRELRIRRAHRGAGREALLDLSPCEMLPQRNLIPTPTMAC